MRRVKSKGLILRVPSSSRLQTSNIRTVTQLSLRVATNNLIIPGLLKEKLVLNGGTLFLKCLQEHRRVQTVRGRFADEVIRSVILLLAPLVLIAKTLQVLGSLEGSLKTICASAKVILGLIKHGVCLKNLKNSIIALKNFFCEEECRELINIDVGLSAFLRDELRALRA